MIKTLCQPLVGGISTMVQDFGGHRIRFDLEDGSGRGMSAGGAEVGDAAGATDGGDGPAAPEPMSIREAITASLRQQDEAANPAADDATAQAVADGRARNPDGTFAPKPGDGDSKAALPVEPPDAAQSQAKPTPVAAPEALTPAEREAFAKLPPEAQTLVAQQIQQIAHERQFYGEMAPAMQQVQAAAQHFRAHPSQVLEAWAQVQRNLLQDPAAAIKGLAQQFGVDLSKIGSPTQQAEQDVYVDPQVAALRQELANVQRFVQSQQQREQQAQRQREEAEVRAVSSTVQDFAVAKDDAGQPKYPHFEAVRGHMAALISAGAAKDLADAYEQAVWSNPDLRQQLLAAQQQQQDRQQQAAKRQQAERARSAAASVVGAPGGVAPPPSPGDTSIRALLAKGAGMH